MADRQHNENISLNKLKKLYKRGTKENPNRYNIKISITRETYEELRDFLPIGNGLYGSAFIELAVRFLMEVLDTGENLDSLVIEELKQVADSGYIINNLERVKRLLEV